MKKRSDWKVLVSCFVVVYLVAFVGSLFTSFATDSDWYDLIRPSITPPNWVFPVVWNILFFLIALSLYFCLSDSKNFSVKKKVGFVFGVNFLLNIFWSALYFGLRNPAYAFVEIIFLLASIGLMIKVAFGISRKAGWLLVPYFVWVGFASVLNYLSI